METKSLLVLLLATSCWSAVGATLSKTDAKKTHKTDVDSAPADLSVLDRGLVVSDPQWRDIVREERRYCSHVRRTFQGPVLGYVTPVGLRPSQWKLHGFCAFKNWNSHGYDVAKTFGSKLTSVSPVWLQVRRRGRNSYDVNGLHDHDPGWVKDVKKSNRKIRMVPRLLFDGWSYKDYMSVLQNEDEIEELGIELVDVAKTEGFDGFTLELWSQLGGNKRKELIHLIKHVCETLKATRLDCYLVIPPALTR
ncbi:Chitinase domain-containing protein 1 [Merluccius polli]|uniref:Chitinase domain-containing protein 1 n=1 Tax=Merluccius polli TaxID=89951 RepID=A0AA47MRU5_MERPO|nr:Chitinase domain-containing protein 1 [Merluccius polli]